jgi:phytoene synthase
VSRVLEPSRGATGAGSSAGAPNVLTPTRYLAWLYSPSDQQPAFAALCEIESEVAASLRPGVDHHVAHARLQWWRDESERVGRGQPVHPLTRELVKHYGSAGGGVSAVGGVPGAPPDISGFVDTAVWDLASATFETRKELTAYCERWAGVMFEPWRTLGAAVREIELLANLAPEARAGRLRVPLDELERAGVDPKDLPKSPWPAALAALLRERHTTLRAAVSQGIADIEREAQASARGLMVWAALAWRMSLRAQSALPGMIAAKRYHAFADGWQAWRAARRAAAGALRLN